MRPAVLFATLLVASSAVAQTSDPRIALMEGAGNEALAKGQNRTASEIFRSALASDPNNPRLHVGAAAAAYADRRDDDAKADLDRALSLAPKLPSARLLLGLVLHRKGDLLGAIRLYDSLAHEPGIDKTVQVTLERWQREFELQLRMQQTFGDRFAVSFEGPAEETVAAKAIASLNRAVDRICAILNTYPTRTIPVVLYTTEQFTDITRAPAWAAAAYDGTIRVPMRGAIEEQAELDRVLAHEFTHALVHTLASSSIPTWLNEGVATALESEDLGWARSAVSRVKPVPLNVLSRSFGRFTGGQATLAYATSALAVRRMLDDAGGFAVANLIHDLGDGVDFDTAFARRIQRSFGDFESSFRE